MTDDWTMGDLATQDPDQLARARLTASNMSLQPPLVSYDNPDNPPLVDAPPQAAPQWMMGQLAAQDRYRPMGNDPWTGLMRGQQDLPLEGASWRDPNSPVVFKTAGGGSGITQQDIDNAASLGMAFSGGGLGIKAYHGSPHDFERFDLSKIGTGEGAQAYGHGLYFAENEGVARGYRDTLARDMYYTPSGEMFDPQSQLQHLNVRVAARGNGPDLDATIARARELLPKAGEQTRPMIEHDIGVLQSFKDAGGVAKNPGRMYEVNINADPAHFLDWDKPLAEQSGHINDKLKQVFDQSISGREAYQSLISDRPGGGGMTSAGIRLGATPEAASGRFNATGIPGIKYLDERSRGPIPASMQHVLRAQGLTDIPRTSNYVVFNPDIIDILRKYGIAGAAPAGMGALAAQDQYNTP